MANRNATLVLNTYQALVSSFCDFFTVVTHTVLYERGIYPESTFLSARRYNCAVRQNRHPKVCQWIIDAVAAMEGELLKGTVEKASLIVVSPDSRPLERFVFDVAQFPSIPASEALTEFESQPQLGIGNTAISPVSVVDIEEQFRAVIRKIATCNTRLGRLPSGCTYTLAVELADSSDPPIGHPQPWIPSQPSLQRQGKGPDRRAGSDLGGSHVVPIRAVEAGEFILECWAEETREKTRDTNQTTQTSSEST